jgi:hypothetical protein
MITFFLFLRFKLNVELLNDINNINAITWKDDIDNPNVKPKVIMEFPLLDKTRLVSNEFEYLLDVLENEIILINLIILLDSNDNMINTDVNLIFPTTMTLSKYTEIPKWDTNILINDYLMDIQAKLLYHWEYRKKFILEIQNIAAVIDFDPYDFSMVSYVIRLKSNNLFVLCSIEIRLSNNFPIIHPLISIYDIQTSFCTPIDSSLVKFNSLWKPEVSAKEIFLFSCDIVHKHAFNKNLI